MFLGLKVADYGLLLVPRNYAHGNGVWDLFKEARYYRWCLTKFAGVNPDLLSRLAIVGYTQEAFICDKWVKIDTAIIKRIKEMARKTSSE